MITNWDKSSEFVRLFSSITGIIMGFGFLFIGMMIGNNKFVIILFGFISLAMGIITFSTLPKEDDEYDLDNITPQVNKKSM